MWPFKKNETKIAMFRFKLDDLTADQKLDLLYDHLFLSKGKRTLPAIGTSLILTISTDSTDILEKRSYYSKLEKI
jgi:hypothetical protein